MTEQHYHQRQTDKGPGYRSRAEVRIAGLLDREGIAYRYEHPLAVVDQGKTRIWYPDLCLPEYGMILESFGVNGDVGYDRRTEHKMKVYETTGVEGVFLNEDTLRRHGPAGITGRSRLSTAVTQRLPEHSSPRLTNDVYTSVDPVLRQAASQLAVSEWL